MWKDIESFEGLYKINEYGDVMRCDTNQILSPYINNKGYKCVDLSKNNVRSKHLIHRLVAQAFVPNPEGYPIVLHKDNIKTNTHYTNLKWGTYSENNAQAIHDQLNRVPKPDNTKFYEVYNPNNPEDKVVFQSLKAVISANECELSESAYRNYIFRDTPISYGKYKGYKIRVSKVTCPIWFKEFY